MEAGPLGLLGCSLLRKASPCPSCLGRGLARGWRVLSGEDTDSLGAQKAVQRNERQLPQSLAWEVWPGQQKVQEGVRSREPYLHFVLRTLLCSLGFLFVGPAPCRTVMLGLQGPMASGPFSSLPLSHSGMTPRVGVGTGDCSSPCRQLILSAFFAYYIRSSLPLGARGPGSP